MVVLERGAVSYERGTPVGRTRTLICPGKLGLKRGVVLFYNVEGRARTEWFQGPLPLSLSIYLSHSLSKQICISVCLPVYL